MLTDKGVSLETIATIKLAVVTKTEDSYGLRMPPTKMIRVTVSQGEQAASMDMFLVDLRNLVDSIADKHDHPEKRSKDGGE